MHPVTSSSLVFYSEKSDLIFKLILKQINLFTHLRFGHSKGTMGHQN